MKHIKLFENWQEDNIDPLSFRPVTPQQAEVMITRALRIQAEGAGGVKPIMLVGAPGMGKQAIIKAAADEASVEPIMLDLSFMGPEDFMGVPSVTNTGDNSGMTTRSIPSWFPMEGSGIIVLDSIDRAERQIANAAIQFATSGRLGGNQLPEGWLIVATADGTEISGTFISDRFTVLNLG